MLYCVFNIKKSVDVDSLVTDEIVFIELKTGKFVISETLYLENKDLIDNLNIPFVIRAVPQNQFT